MKRMHFHYRPAERLRARRYLAGRHCPRVEKVSAGMVRADPTPGGPPAFELKALSMVRLRQSTDRHPGLVVGRGLCFTGARASKVDGPILAGGWLKTRPEGATAVTGGDDPAAIPRLSGDEVPSVFVHVRNPCCRPAAGD